MADSAFCTQAALANLGQDTQRQECCSCCSPCLLPLECLLEVSHLAADDKAEVRLGADAALVMQSA